MKLRYEQGADGKPQAVIPGAERRSVNTLARDKAAAPLRSDKVQKPCDLGLFADDVDQLDLEIWLTEQSEP